MFYNTENTNNYPRPSIGVLNLYFNQKCDSSNYHLNSVAGNNLLAPLFSDQKKSFFPKKNISPLYYGKKSPRPLLFPPKMEFAPLPIIPAWVSHKFWSVPKVWNDSHAPKMTLFVRGHLFEAVAINSMMSTHTSKDASWNLSSMWCPRIPCN